MKSNAMDILRDAGFDVDGALGRLMNNPAFYLKMLGKFLQDTNFAKLREAVAAGDMPAAGECAHAVKGVTATLGVNQLSGLCSKLQMLYQGREAGDPEPVLAEADVAYEQAIAVIREALE